MRNAFILGMALVAIILTAALASMTLAEPQKISIVKVLDKGTNSGIDKQSLESVSSKAQWCELWKRHQSKISPQPAVPEVDFNKHSILAAFLGTRSSGGYGVSIEKIKDAGDKLEVTLKESKPPQGAITASMMTAPFEIVLIEKNSKPVTPIWK